MPFKPVIVPPAEPSQKEKVRIRVRKAARDGGLLTCRCGSTSFVTETTGMRLIDGKPTGGTKQLICSFCLAKGERVVSA